MNNPFPENINISLKGTVSANSRDPPFKDVLTIVSVEVNISIY